jgi:murein DD-endopeptidase
MTMQAGNDKRSSDSYHTGRIKFWGETIGLHPFSLRLQQARVALLGEEDVPASLYDLSSLKQLKPGIAIPLWLGKQKISRKVIITNCFNHLQTPIELGWSVKITQVKDFRDRQLTYDSHNGTDFAVPIGTTLLAAAPGKVVLIRSEFNRGGLKVFIDHGQGLMTCCAHLTRQLVQEGEIVRRGQAIAITGYSGLDSLVTFPFGTPHVHFNTWLNGEPVDPFPYDNEVSLWRAGDHPKPTPNADDSDSPFSESLYREEHVDQAISSCLTAKSKHRLAGIHDLNIRAAHTIAEMNYYPTRFPGRVNLYQQTHPRQGVLDLPFENALFDGIVFADEI